MLHRSRGSILMELRSWMLPSSAFTASCRTLGVRGKGRSTTKQRGNRRLRRSWSRGARCSRTVLLRTGGCAIYGANTSTQIWDVHRVSRYRRCVAHAQPQRGSFTAAKVLWRGAMLLCECRVAGPCSGPSRGGHRQVQGIVKRCVIAGQWPFPHNIIVASRGALPTLHTTRGESATGRRSCESTRGKCYSVG
jgi:hypothetical protein